MRRIVTFNWLSADGYFAGPVGDLDWVVPDQEQAQMAARDVSSMDTILFGRRTYEIFAAFWGRIAVDEAGTVPDPHNCGRRSPEHGAIAIAFNKMTKLVFSRTLDRVDWRNSRVLRELDPREIKRLKEQPGKDIIVFGGSVVAQLTQHGLIDEYQFAVCPVLLGSGRPLIAGVSQRSRLELLEAKTLKSGDVMLRYARPKSP